MMQDRLRPTRVSPIGRLRARGIFTLVVGFFLCVFGVVLLSNKAGSAGSEPMQLVRLTINTDAGFVRIEITADGAFNATGVDQYSRGRQTTIRIRGARSLLRQSYEINDNLARDIRTVEGQRNGEPYVDVMITLGDGATIAQRKSFNRLLIGVASDFARLRRPTHAGPDLAKTSPQDSAPAGVKGMGPAGVIHPRLMSAVDVETKVASGAPKTSSAIKETAHVLPPVAASTPAPVFRGRTIWGAVPSEVSHFSGRGTGGFLQTFFVPQSVAQNTPQTEFVKAVPMGLEPPGARRGVWVPGTTASQRDEVGGLELGSGYLRPSLHAGATYGDNYFYRSTTGRNLGVFTLAPLLEYEIPGNKRAMRVAYEPRLRRLSMGEWATGHRLDFDARFDLTPFFRLALRDHFIRSPLDPREFDPAGEVYIVGDTFNRNDAGLRAEYDVSDRSRLALDSGYNVVRWSRDHIAGAPTFLDYDELAGSVTYERDVFEETTATIGFTFNNGTSSVPLRPQFDGLNDFRRYLLEIGGRTQFTETSGMAFKVGYARDVFRNAPEANDFSGLVFDLRFRRDLTSRTNFELAALRKTQVSAFNPEGGNASLLSTGGAAHLETRPAEDLKLGLGVTYQQLGFPMPIVLDSTASGGILVGEFAGERRKDHLYGVSLEAAYRLSDLLKTRLLYSFLRRDSTIPVFTFNRNRLSLVFEIGRRNPVRGRPF